ncbi:hypothetical protein Glove_492g8 [Diversispora epigaea]|uniref:Uncharacterized protein n=1 Tax=Diversispora epigaea TaxID=1348612 RepID=A0A397GIH1_9GLOM|nr:hypothetical protein Glove_492g8 [Diversispora epigaea]
MNSQTKSDKILTLEYLNWHAKIIDLSSTLTDKICIKNIKKETGHEPWQKSKAMVSMSAKSDSSRGCIVEISKFLEEKTTILEVVQKRFPFLTYTNSNAWY